MIETEETKESCREEIEIHRGADCVRAEASGGVHFCLGARLAQLELNIALETLLRCLPDLKITNLESLRWQPKNVLCGVESLLAQWAITIKPALQLA